MRGGLYARAIRDISYYGVYHDTASMRRGHKQEIGQSTTCRHVGRGMYSHEEAGWRVCEAVSIRENASRTAALIPREDSHGRRRATRRSRACAPTRLVYWAEFKSASPRS